MNLFRSDSVLPVSVIIKVRLRPSIPFPAKENTRQANEIQCIVDIPTSPIPVKRKQKAKGCQAVARKTGLLARL